MSAGRSKRYMNWTGVSFAPIGGGPVINFGGVTSVSFDAGGSLLKSSGDGDRYNSVLVNDFNEPTAKVESQDIGAVNSIAVGQVGTLTATHNDAKNGVGSGAITYNFLCICSKNGLQGKHRAFGMSDLEFDGYSADGVTNPLSTTVAA